MYDSASNAVQLVDFRAAHPRRFGAASSGDRARKPPAYLAPARLEGRNVKGHTDLFTPGVTLLPLLTGELPIRGNSMIDLTFVIASEPRGPIGTLRADRPRAVCAIFDKARAKTPAARFGDGAGMAALRRAAAASV